MFKWSNCSIWAMDRTLTDTTSASQSGPWSNGNEGVINITQSSRTWAWSSDCLLLLTGHSFVGRHLHICSDAVRYFSRPTYRHRIYRMIYCCIFAFDPAKNAIPRWCTGRKWHILMAAMRGNRVGGNWLMKWDEVKKFPWYTHRLMHRKRVTCQLHDSYFRLMTIQHAIPKIE